MSSAIRAVRALFGALAVTLLIAPVAAAPLTEYAFVVLPPALFDCSRVRGFDHDFSGSPSST